MKHVLTLKGFDAICELDYQNEAEGIKDVYSIAIVAGKSSAEVGKLKPTAYAQMKTELLQQAVNPGNPVYLVKYKGTTYGYHPAEIGTVEDMAAIEVFSKEKKWNALAAVLFRPVKPMSRWAHWRKNRWKNSHGIQVKEIRDFKRDSLTYLCNDIDMSTMDLSYWDDFPWQILASNLAFLMEGGLKFSLSIHPSSLRSKRIQSEVKTLSQNFKEVLYGLIWQRVSHQLLFLSSTDETGHSTWLPESYAAGLLSKNAKETMKNLKDNTSLDAWIVTGGDNTGLLESLYDSFNNILKSNRLEVNELLLLMGMMKINKYKTRLDWVI